VSLIPSASAFADTEKAFFDSYPNGTRVVQSGNVTFANGIVTQNAFPWRIQGKTYTSYRDLYGECGRSYGCTNAITMTFAQPVSDINVLVFTADYSCGFLDWTDDLGHRISTLSNTYCGGAIPIAPVTNFTWPYKGVRKLTIAAGDTYWAFGVGILTYTIAPTLGIVARLGDDPNAPNEPDPVLPSGTLKANIPLGRSFSIRLKRKVNGVWQNVPATFTLSPGTVQGGPAFPQETLYLTDPVFLYNTPPDPATRMLQSVHLGSSPLNITPTDKSLPPITLTVRSIEPASLGPVGPGNVTQWDGRLWEQGSIRGIPPQYLKAVVDHETGHSYNKREWRYEPDAERRYVVPQRTRSPYSNYVIPQDVRLPGGPFLCPPSVNAGCGFTDLDDLLPKTVLYYERAGVRAFIPPYDFGAKVLIQEICNGNPSQRWPCPPPAPPLPPPVGRIRPSGGNPWYAIANPQEASSYGLFQTTWYSVIDQYASNVFGGATPELGGGGLRQNPALLFDDDKNIARGTASIVTGPNELRWAFVDGNKSSINVINPQFNTVADLRSAFRNALIRYNGAVSYADVRVLPLVPNFLGVLPANVVVLEKPCSGSPSVSSWNSDMSIVAGGTVTLSVASPEAGSFQWYVGSAGNTSSPVTDGDTSSIQVSPGSMTHYWVRVANSCGTTSEEVTVAVGADCGVPQIQSVSANQTVTRGTPVSLNVTGTGNATYQWYALPEGGELAFVPNGTTPSITVTPQTNTTYFVAASNGCQTVYSQFVIVTVMSCDGPLITAAPSPSTVIQGQSAVLSIAVGGTAPLTVQWRSTDGIVVGTGASIQVTPSQTTNYFAHVTNACGAVDSDVVQVTVSPSCSPPAITSQPQSSQIVQGLSAALSVGVSGTSPTYQWYQGPLGNTSTPVPGATGTGLTVSPFSTTTYWVEVRNACGVVRSSPATVTVVLACEPATINAPPASTSILTGDSLELTVDASGSDPLTYQWFTGASGDESQPISGGSGPSVAVTPAGTTSYWVRVSNGCGNVPSPAATVTVRRFCIAAHIATQPTPITIDVGGSARLSVVVAGTQPIDYQWYIGDPGDRTTPVVNAFSSVLTISPTATTNYWVEAINDCGTAMSSGVTVKVDVLVDCSLTFTTQPPTSINTVAGTAVSVSAVAAGTGTPAYQWFSAAPNGLWIPVDGETSSGLTVSPLTTTYYYLHASIACMAIDSDVVVVTVQPACTPPQIASVPQSLTAAPAQEVTLTVTPAGTAPLTLQWYASTDGITYTPIADAIGTSYTFSAVSSASYVARAFNDCGEAASAVSQLTVASSCTAPQITVDPISRSISTGQQVTLTVDATGSDLVYQWWSSVGLGWTRTDGDSSQITISPSVTTYYYVNVSNACGGGDSNYAVITVVSVLPCTGPPAIAQQPLPATVVAGSTVNVSVDAIGATAYQWFQTGNRLERGGLTPITGQTGPTLSFAPQFTTSVRVRVSNACGYVDSAIVLITVAPACQPPALLSPVGFLTYYAGEALTIPVSYSGTNVQFQWYKSEPAGVPLVPIASATNATLVDYPAADSAIYQVQMWNECGQVTSALWTAYSQSRCVIPTITSLSPMDQTITSGEAASITATATANTPITYQWYEAILSTLSWSPISNSNVSTITVSPTQDMWYRVVASTDCGTITQDAPIVRVVQP
jgi:hypothetical protein